MTESCGGCKYFEEVGYANWGNCNTPLPYWIERSSNRVAKGGRASHLCEAFKPRVDTHESTIPPIDYNVETQLRKIANTEADLPHYMTEFAEKVADGKLPNTIAGAKQYIRDYRAKLDASVSSSMRRWDDEA